MNLPAYEIITKIAELKSLSRTAEYFSYTPSRISQILKAAEEELGVPLFRREKSGLIPTMECTVLLPALRELLNSEKCFQEQLSRLKNVEAGAVRIGRMARALLGEKPATGCLSGCGTSGTATPRSSLS